MVIKSLVGLECWCVISVSNFASQYNLLLYGVEFWVELCIAHLSRCKISVQWIGKESVFELNEGRRTHTDPKASSIQHREFPPAWPREKEEAESATPCCTDQSSSAYAIEEGWVALAIA